MKIIGSILNNLGFICLLICLVLLCGQYIMGSDADAVIFAGQEIGIGAVRNFFTPIFNSEISLVRLVVDHLIPCTVGSFCVMILGSILHKAGKKK